MSYIPRRAGRVGETWPIHRGKARQKASNRRQKRN